MATKYDQWVGTQYTELPIDYYQAALSTNEGREIESLNNIKLAADAYSKVVPYSPNAQAFYEQTVNEMLDRVHKVTAQGDISTPQAKRQINNIVNDRALVNQLEQVMLDAQYGQARKQELQEYLKKNPAVNAYGYNQVFNNLNRETGDATKFDYKRFQNLAPLSEYYDLSKVMEEGISKLKADETEMMRVVGPMYKNTKNKALVEEKIRKYVADKLKTDPRAQEQMRHNLNYQYYMADPYNVDEGRKKVANSYRQYHTNALMQMQSSLETLQARLKTAKNDTERHQVNAAIQQLKKAGELSKSIIATDETGGFAVDDETLNNSLMFDAFTKGFDAFAYRESSDGEKYNPAYLALLHHQYAMQRQKAKADAAKQAVEGVFNAIGTYDAREGGPSGQREFADRVTQLFPNVKLDATGALRPENYSTGAMEVNQAKAGGPITTPKGGMRLTGVNPRYEGKYFAPEDVVFVEPNGKPPAGYTRLGSGKRLEITPGGAGSARDGGGGVRDGAPVDVYIRPNAQMHTTARGYMDGRNNGGYTRAANDVVNWVKSNSLDPEMQNLDPNKDVDVKKALQMVDKFTGSMDSYYSRQWSNKISQSGEFRSYFANSLGGAEIYVDGKRARIDGKGQLVIAGKEGSLKDSNLQGLVRSTPFNIVDYDNNVRGAAATYTITGKDGQAHQVRIGLPADLQTMLSSSGQANMALKTGSMEPQIINGQDLSVYAMGQNGAPLSKVVVGGGRPEYQKAAAGIHSANISKLKKAGLNDVQAENWMRANYERIAAEFANGNSFIGIVGGQKVQIDAPSLKFNKRGQSVFYVPAQLTPEQQEMQRKGIPAVQGLDEYERMNVNKFSSRANPFIDAFSTEFFGKKQMLGVMSNMMPYMDFGGDGDDDAPMPDMDNE